MVEDRVQFWSNIIVVMPFVSAKTVQFLILFVTYSAISCIFSYELMNDETN
jgi:hypothetical protein